MEENPMFSKPKSWLSGGLWRPKNPHSLEHLKYLHGVVCKNPTVTEQNRALLVETLRSISEILIWGDQNDSSVFDFFLEKNMLGFFLRFMKQKYGRFICVQLLQTLNILFDNISNETSVYYLLSNNHINSIIVHKFDFSDEEVMAYYISFLKTLSLKLNKHTIHFFYNEHTNDFALYTEAIKFFNHSESMVRIAVRTITLNVYKACHFASKLDARGQPRVDDKSMLRFIRDKTAAPYFSNLVWFIGNHVLELDLCVRHDIDHNSRDRLADLVAEHLDHLHYLNDILCLNIDALNEVLTDHLLNRLLIPLYVYSLEKRSKYAPQSDRRPHVDCVVSLFLLSQVFLIMHHAPLVRQLADIIFHSDRSVIEQDESDAAAAAAATANADMGPKHASHRSIREFVKPTESLAKTLDSARGGGKPMKRPNYSEQEDTAAAADTGKKHAATKTQASTSSDSSPTHEGKEAVEEEVDEEQGNVEGEEEDISQAIKNSTDDEKLLTAGAYSSTPAEFTLENRPYLEVLFKALECSESDYEALFTLCLLYAIGHNTGINQELLDSILMPSDRSSTKENYNVAMVETLINIISLSCKNNSRIRLATLELCIKLLKTLVHTPPTPAPTPAAAPTALASSASAPSLSSTPTAAAIVVVGGGGGSSGGQCFLQDRHLAAVEGAREEATLMLRNFYKVWEKSEEIFLDMFEDEYREMKNRPLNVEYLTMDASILLPPTGTPLTGIDFNKRLPCGEVERARKAIRVFFYLRDLSIALQNETDTQLPLTKQEECVKLGDVLDLNNSDLIGCTVISKDNKRERRFLVIDVLQLILVEPDTRRLGWGKVRFVGFLQDVEVAGDKEDSRSLHITIHKPSMNAHAKPLPLLCARFLFDDHIRCMAAKQRLTKGRLKARQRKMQMIARLLELPASIVDSMYTPPSSQSPFQNSAVALRASSRSQRASGSGSAQLVHPGRAQSELVGRSVFASVDQTGAFDSARAQDMAAKEPRHLPRQSSRPKSQQQQTGNVPASVIKPASSGVLSQKQQDRLKKKAEKVAKAKQAAAAAAKEQQQKQEQRPEPPASPEAHAFRSLNQSSQKSSESIRGGNGGGGTGKLSRNSSSSSLVKEPIEIPLEDLSQKSSAVAGSSSSGLRTHRSMLAESHKSPRSSSFSPSRRGRRLSSDSSVGSATGSNSGSRPASRSPLSVSERRERAGSCPSPRSVRSSSTSSASSNSIDVTSFIKPDRRHARAERIVIGGPASAPITSNTSSSEQPTPEPTSTESAATVTEPAPDVAGETEEAPEPEQLSPPAKTSKTITEEEDEQPETTG